VTQRPSRQICFILFGRIVAPRGLWVSSPGEREA